MLGTIRINLPPGLEMNARKRCQLTTLGEAFRNEAEQLLGAQDGVHLFQFEIVHAAEAGATHLRPYLRYLDLPENPSGKSVEVVFADGSKVQTPVIRYEVFQSSLFEILVGECRNGELGFDRIFHFLPPSLGGSPLYTRGWKVSPLQGSVDPAHNQIRSVTIKIVDTER
ncbi:MAG: hypothetical protein BWY68_00953 [bacterium ADurb.Bin400]|nr:MAG: hypothetical protein BWY68_00953 [bacterium ADurb.Bin400]